MEEIEIRKDRATYKKYIKLREFREDSHPGNPIPHNIASAAAYLLQLVNVDHSTAVDEAIATRFEPRYLHRRIEKGRKIFRYGTIGSKFYRVLAFGPLFLTGLLSRNLYYHHERGTGNLALFYKSMQQGIIGSMIGNPKN